MTTEVPPIDAERRRSPRRRTLLAGKLAYGDPQVTANCTVRSLAPDGAMIEIETVDLLPRQVILAVISEGMAYECRVAWTRGLRCGLEAHAKHDLRGPVDPHLRRLQAVWKELAPR